MGCATSNHLYTGRLCVGGIYSTRTITQVGSSDESSEDDMRYIVWCNMIQARSTDFGGSRATEHQGTLVHNDILKTFSNDLLRFILKF
jgi:hypothetical protein